MLTGNKVEKFYFLKLFVPKADETENF